MKRILAWLLCALLVIPTGFAMASDAAVDYTDLKVNLDGSLPIVEDPSLLQTMTIITPVSERCFTDTNEIPQVTYIKEQTGVNFEWIPIPDAGYSEKVNLMLASRDLPDMFYRGINFSTITQYIGQDVFLPTDALIEEYCPNITRVFEQRPEYAALTLYADGHRYGFPYVEEMFGLTLTSGPFVINQTWLDQLGLPMPTTIQEFKDTLIAFRDAGDLNGNGEADEIPYACNFVASDTFSTVNTFFQLMSCFGETGTYGDSYPYTKIGENNEVIFTALSDAFKECLHFYRGLYEENLLDMDGFSGEGDYTYKLRLDDAVIGSFAIWSPEGTMTVRSVYEQYQPLPRLQGDKGAMGAACNRSELWDTSQCILTTACKYPEVAAAWVNFLNEPEMAITTNWGAVGHAYYRDEATGLLRFPLDENGYFILPEGMESYNDVRQNSTPAQGGIIILNEYYDTIAEYTYDAAPLLAWQRVNGKDEVLAEDTPTPPVPMTPDEQAEYSQILPQIRNIVKSYMTSSILDGGIDENWSSYEQQLNDAGLPTMLQLIQNAYDRYLVTYNEYAGAAE